MLFRPNRHLTFSRFESRASSIRARSASAHFAMRQGICYQEPMLILAGRSSAGKTHLLHATANLAMANAYIRSGTTINAKRLAEEVQRATKYGDLRVWLDRFAQEDFLGVDDVDELFGHVEAANFLLEVLHRRSNANLRTVVSVTLSVVPGIPCPLNTFLDHQRAEMLL